MVIEWNTVLTRDELSQYWRDTASLDPCFERCARMWWEGASINTLHAQRAGAWLANEREAYCLARSYLVRAGAPLQ